MKFIFVDFSFYINRDPKKQIESSFNDSSIYFFLNRD